MSQSTTVFFLSDGTGITAEKLGQTLLSQFAHIKFKRVRRPYLTSMEAVAKVADEINLVSENGGLPTLVFSTLVAEASRELLRNCNARLFDLYDQFVEPMESCLGVEASHEIGLSHGMGTFDAYQVRIDALNYTMANDDGISTKNLDQADVILIGVSRSGKTPTCLYLALNYGIQAANYPLTVDDLEFDKLPASLASYKNKIMGLSINPNRLQQIRQKRKSKSQYAALSQCQYETRSAEALYKKFDIPFLDSSTMSIEEIATSILQIKKLKRRING
ncbi:MAG TPA: kinase/pyrophosphorylase [Gammaproteobacteria bacterium]|nr:kinase/pyrophosphorylase [Gammaproteobacteria bacterium]